MLRASDLTKAELLQVMKILDVTAGYYLERALSQIERQRNDAHYEKSRQLIAEEKKHYEIYFDMLQPYEGKPITDIHWMLPSVRRPCLKRHGQQGESGTS